MIGPDSAILTLLGLGVLILMALAKHGFSAIVKQLESQGADIKAIREKLVLCVTWAELEKELDRELTPLKTAVQEHGIDLEKVKAHCEERHR